MYNYQFTMLVLGCMLLFASTYHGREASRVEYRYLPRSYDMLMKDSEKVGSIFKPMFNGTFQQDRMR